MDMSFGGNGSGEDHDEAARARRAAKSYHRHSTEQIQHLEAFFKECPHPDENQRRLLGRDLGLEPKQIKFWFQNKRTQTKAQHERADNNSLRMENERIHCENIALREALNNIVCLQCDGPSLNEEARQRTLEMLQKENTRLKNEHERLAAYVSSLSATPDSNFPALLPNAIGSLKYMSDGNISSQGLGAGGPLLDAEHAMGNSRNIPSLNQMNGINEMDKSAIVEASLSAIDEFMELVRLNEPMWIMSQNDGTYHLHRDTYDKVFPKSNRFKSSSARLESSKDSGVVAMNALQLVDIFTDAEKWMAIFPTIVTKAGIIEVIDTGSLGGGMFLMHEKMHILSPLVAPREFIFVRYCRQLDSNIWVMVDVSYDSFKELHDASLSRAWRYPSGCIIEDLQNGSSKVTWIEHVQVDDKSQTHRLYRDLVYGCQAYGAKLWIVTLQRMSERFAYSLGAMNTPRDELERIIGGPDGKKNLTKLSHRMVKNFFETLSAADTLDFPHLSEMNISGVRVSVRKSEGPGQPSGLVVSVATSLWLPLSCENIFNFLKDVKARAKWDVLSNGSPVNEIARIATGAYLGNSISLIQPYVPKEQHMLILQESSIDSLGAVIIYAPIDLPAITASINGEDTTQLPILPSGFVISGDGRSHKPGSGVGASTSASSSSSKSVGSLLTVAFQLLGCCDTVTKQIDMEAVATVHSLISTTIQKIKAALDCADLD